MLLDIRERITGIIAWVVVIGISVVFIFWGVNSYFGNGQERFAIQVDGSKVSFRDYEQQLNMNRRQLMQMFGGRVPAGFDAEKYLREQTIDQAINRELFAGFVDKYRFRIPASQVLAEITADSRFQIDDQFRSDLYDTQLRSMGVAKQEYEQQVQQQIEASQFEAGIRNTAALSKQEFGEFAKLQNQSRDFEFAQFSLVKQQSKPINVSDEEIEAFYADEANRSRFITEEQVKIEYVELSLQQIADAVKVDDDVLRQQYEDGIKQGRYQSDEIRQASHILVKVPQDATEAVVAEKRAEIEGLREKIVAGAAFEKVAKEKSEDAGSAAQGGSLGEVRRGAWVKPFEDVAFALEKGVLSEPVRTRFGFHLIRVDDIKGGEIRPFEQVKSELVKDYRSQQSEPLFYDRLDRLETLAYESSDLNEAAEAVEAKLQTTEWFSRKAGSGIADYPLIRQTAFDEEILKDGRNSSALEVEPQHVVVFRVTEHKPSRAETIEEAKAKIIAELKNQKARAALNDLAKQAAQDVQSGTAVQGLAKHYDAEYKQLKDVKRDATTVPPEVLQAVFRLPQPGEQPVVDRVSISNGDIALVRLTRVADGDVQWLSDEERARLIRQLVQQRGQYDLAATVAALREKAEIVISPELQTE